MLKLTSSTIAIAAALALLLTAACDDVPDTADSGAPDSQTIDATRSPDLGSPDMPGVDQGAPDAAKPDISTPDAQQPDAQPPDAQQPDAQQPDAKVYMDMPSGCNATKIGFTQANTSKYELWELCFTAGDAATEALIKKIDSKANCSHNSGGIAAKCPTGTWRCMSGLDRDPVTKAVTAAAWTKLCQMSVLPAVTKIVGGWYI